MLGARTLGQADTPADAQSQQSNSGSSCNASGGGGGINSQCVAVGVVLLLLVGIILWGLVKLWKYLRNRQVASLKRNMSLGGTTEVSEAKIDPQNLQSSTGRPGMNGKSPQKKEEILDTSGTFRADLSQFPDEDEPVIFLTLTRTVFDHYMKRKKFGAEFRNKFEMRL